MILIEKIDNGLQLLCLLACMVLSVYNAVRSNNRLWTLIAMYFTVYALGNLYWFLYMLFYGETPYISFVPDFCWLSAFLFLLLLVMVAENEYDIKLRNKVFLFVPIFTFGMCLFYMQRGDYLTNLIYAVFMTLLICYSLKGLMINEKTEGKHSLYRAVLVFCTIEYCLWTSSCFDPPLFNLYYLFDIMLTLSNINLYQSVRKAVKDELY